MKRGTYPRTPEINHKTSESKKRFYADGGKHPRSMLGKVGWNKGKKWSDDVKKKISLAHIGMKQSDETRRKRSEAMKGDKCYNWKGGKTSENILIRESVEYKLWREAVFSRDKWNCIWGGKEHGNKLHADHIKPFSLYPELRFAIDNGRTLCENCHRKTDTYAGKLNKKTLK